MLWRQIIRVMDLRHGSMYEADYMKGSDNGDGDSGDEV